MLATQLSRNSRAKSLSSLSSAVMSIVDLTDDLSSSDLIPQLLSDNVRDDEQPEGEVEFIGNTVANRNSGFVGDAVINALDAAVELNL